jgi:Polysaccharide lyase
MWRVIACAAVEFPVFNVQKDHGMANITSFSAASGSLITVDGLAAYTQNANKSWSVTEPDSNTLQFSVHSGDHWSTNGWSDLTNDGGAERSEVSFNQLYSQGTQINVGYQLTVEPGSPNTASWFCLNQLHATTEGPPPFFVGMDGEHMQIGYNTKSGGMTVLWKDPNPIQRGHAYDMNVQLKMDPSGNGFIEVWRDGVQVVNYHGATGVAGAQYYWKEGIYRGPTTAETQTVDFSNLSITTGSAPAPATSGTTASSSESTSTSTTGSSSSKTGSTRRPRVARP